MQLYSSGFDLNYLNAISRGDKEFMLEVFTIFESKMPEMLQQLNQAVLANDWDQMKFYAHKMKSSYAVFGNVFIIDLLDQLESMHPSNNNSTEIKSIVHSVKSETDKCFQDIIQIKKSLFLE